MTEEHDETAERTSPLDSGRRDLARRSAAAAARPQYGEAGKLVLGARAGLQAQLASDAVDGPTELEAQGVGLGSQLLRETRPVPPQGPLLRQMALHRGQTAAQLLEQLGVGHHLAGTRGRIDHFGGLTDALYAPVVATGGLLAGGLLDHLVARHHDEQAGELRRLFE